MCGFFPQPNVQGVFQSEVSSALHLNFCKVRVITLSTATQRLDIDLVREVRKDLTAFFNKAVSVYGGDDLIMELMIARRYKTRLMEPVLKEIGVFKCDSISDISLIFPDLTNERLRQFGLLTEQGDYLLAGRYVLPIKDIQGDIIALVGWHPLGGTRKYVTTPTLGFSRDTSFFNLDHAYQTAMKQFNGVGYLVEGIFDTLALRAIGLPAMGNQGLELSPFKSQILTRFSKIIAIPDNDRSGMGVNPFLNKASGKDEKFIWRIQNDHLFTVLPRGIKDTDDFVNDFDVYDDLVDLQNRKYMVRMKDVE